MPAWKGVIVDRSTASLEPGQQAGTDIAGQLELYRPASLLLDHRGPVSHLLACDKGAHLDRHEVTSTQLAVDGQVEQRPIPKAPFTVKKGADRPNLPLGQRARCPD